MSNSPEDIIELTDIIEHGPGAPKQEGAGEGVDLSFERELEDLFAEGPQEKPAGATADLPGLDALHLPDETAKADSGEADIDLDGLDALLAEAETGQAEGLNIPELPDDFLEEPAKAPSSEAMAASGQALDAVSSRLDTLEETLAGLSGALAGSFKSMLDEAIAGLKADLPKPLDEEALTARIKEEVLASLPEPAEPQTASPDEVLGQVEAKIEERLSAFKDEIPSVDPAPMIEELSASLEERLSAVEAQASSLAAPDLSGLATLEDLAAMRQDILAEIKNAVPAAAAQIIREEIQALVQEMD